MSGDQLNLDAIEANARHWDHLVRDDPETTLALVAEVRRLRDTLAVVARHRCCRDCGATFEQCQRYRLGRAIKCCPDCHHAA